MKNSVGIKILYIVTLLIALCIGFFAARALMKPPDEEGQEAGGTEAPIPSVETPLSDAVVPPSAATVSLPLPSSRLEDKPSAQLDVPSYNQMELGYPLGCEIISLAMMIDYSASTPLELDSFVAEMPRDNDPAKGYRGDPASTSYGWTILPGALAPLTEKYLGSAVDMSACELSDLKLQLASGAPVLVWVKGLGWAVHCVCLTGYDAEGFYYNDPANGGKDVFIAYEEFDAIWNDPIYDKVLGTNLPVRNALSYEV